jgi:transglutaminase-like putative cysteine protease
LPRAGASPTTFQLLGIPDGVPGTRATLRVMAALVKQYRTNPSVLLTAKTIVRDVPGHKNYSGMVEALHGFVQSRIQYVQDPRGTEMVQTPIKTLEFSQGDCDDQATLLAALLEAVGFKARFVAIKMQLAGPFVHVYSEVCLGTRWIPLETTEKWAAGKGPPSSIVAGRMVQNI